MDWAADSEEVKTADVIVLVTPVPLAWLPVEVIRKAITDLTEEFVGVLGYLSHHGNLVAGAIGYGLGYVLSPVAFELKIGKHDIKDQWTFAPYQRDLQRVLRILFDLANDLDPRTGENGRPAASARCSSLAATSTWAVRMSSDRLRMGPAVAGIIDPTPQSTR